ncbi:hypothetical protein RFI_00817, partial [Reticulomyxa filosa]
MIADSVLVCFFPRAAFTTLNIKAAERFLWVFLKEEKPVSMKKDERWLEIQCGVLINQSEISQLNERFQKTVKNAVADYDFLTHCVIYLRVMFEMGRIAESLKTMSTQQDSHMVRMINLELLHSVRAFAGQTLPTNLELVDNKPQSRMQDYTTIPTHLLSNPMLLNNVGVDMMQSTATNPMYHAINGQMEDIATAMNGNSVGFSVAKMLEQQKILEMQQQEKKRQQELARLQQLHHQRQQQYILGQYDLSSFHPGYPNPANPDPSIPTTLTQFFQQTLILITDNNNNNNNNNKYIYIFIIIIITFKNAIYDPRLKKRDVLGKNGQLELVESELPKSNESSTSGSGNEDDEDDDDEEDLKEEMKYNKKSNNNNNEQESIAGMQQKANVKKKEKRSKKKKDKKARKHKGSDDSGSNSNSNNSGDSGSDSDSGSGSDGIR